MKDDSINKFVLKTLTATIPVLAIVVLYVILDPFGVVRRHEPCPAFKSAIPFNKGYISTCAYIDGRERYKYDSYIFGSSRTINFRAADWAEHIGKNASIFHFDASNETPEGILLKMQFIQSKGDTIRNAMIEIPPIFFNDRSEYLSYRTPWQLDGLASAPAFHYYYLKRFTDWSMFKSVIKYKITGAMPPVEIADKVRFLTTLIDGYDEKTNETYFNSRDSLYALHPEYGISPKYDIAKFHFTDKRATAYHLLILKQINAILQKDRTNFKIILGPMPDYTVLNSSDTDSIKSIFGAKNVYDLSKYRKAYSSGMTFYDNTHFTPFLAKEMLDTVYYCK